MSEVRSSEVQSSEVQATVRTWGADGGTVLLDDGRELPAAASALRPEVRLLRLGQRVRCRVDDGRVEALTLVTLPL